MISSINYVEQSKEQPNKFLKVVFGINKNNTLYYVELTKQELTQIVETINQYLPNMI